ncbi:MAG: hypothetical protein ACQEVA_15755 [Myxococcota bacterium]
MEDLRVLAAESRAVGMPGHKKARDYLVAQMEALGLDAQIHGDRPVDRVFGFIRVAVDT